MGCGAPTTANGAAARAHREPEPEPEPEAPANSGPAWNAGEAASPAARTAPDEILDGDVSVVGGLASEAPPPAPAPERTSSESELSVRICT